MNLNDLFVKPYESYTDLQILLEIAGTFFGILSVFFSIKKIFGFILLVLFLPLFMCISFLLQVYWEIV